MSTALPSPAELPALPPSVAEWEDLLLRMEIMQRVLRNTLEEVPEGDAEAAAVVGTLLARESQVGGWLEEVSGVGRGGSPAVVLPRPEGAPLALADRFVSHRARNFAMLQRRGLEVWKWSGELAGYGPVSAFQLVSWLVARDVGALAALRARAGKGAAAC